MTADKARDGARAESVGFEHKLFSSMENPHFRLSAQNPGQPVMMVSFGENEIALPFDGIRKEFGIDAGSADDHMLKLVAEGLNFVVLLRPGDPIPAELLTGAPSAEISPDHRQIAFQRLTMQLATWVAGDESVVTDRAQLAQIAEDPATKSRINDALGEAAARLGLERRDKDKVLQLIERLADDLAAIEALRDRFGGITAMAEKLQALRAVVKSQQIALELIDPVARLMTAAVRKLAGDFEEIDAQTGEIIALLRNIEPQVRYIRERRNELHQRLLAWTEMLEAWNRTRVEDNEANVRLLRETYRFLAPRFMPVDEWALRSKLLAPEGSEVDPRRSETNHGLAKTEVIW
ncbi:MAG: hypothetical protein QNJ30_24525 [Kiloniellales bacterium]|nr:hypothetical protein [Kiloniellales bacterium]